MELRESEVWYVRLGLVNIIVFLIGIALLALSLYFDGVHLLRIVGFPADKLYHPRVQGDLAILQGLGVLIATLLMISRIILWRYPHVVRSSSEKIEAFISAAAQLPWFIPLSLTTLVLMKTVLQLTLYLTGYMVYAGDEFARAMRGDYWVQHLEFELGGQVGYLALLGGGQLPFPDYLFGLGLALHRDLFLTPKIINLAVSGIAVIAVYFLGRELFGRTAGFLTASLFAFLPWNVWLGISGETSDLPSVTLITLFALFLFRWLETDQPRALLAAAGYLSVANSFRYENWFFSLVFSLLIAFSTLSRWRQRRLAWQAVSVAVCALAIINAFPIIWMAASYYILGDWLPALHKTNAFMVAFMGSSQTVRPQISNVSIPVLALASFPFEIAVSIGGIALFVRSDTRKSFRLYLIVLVATFLLFNVVFKGQLAAFGGIARYLLPYVVLLLPYAGFLLTQLPKTPELGWNQGILASCLILLATGTFDVIRAFNYPGTAFPRDAIYAGWTIRGLQETGTIPKNGKILIERAADWGDVGIVALANRPERFVLLNELAYRQAALLGEMTNKPAPVAFSGNEGVRGDACEKGFHVEACKKSLFEEKFNLVILSSPERVFSFQETFHGRSWTIGRYHIFEVNSSPSLGYPAEAGLDKRESP
jgi:Dolichyl-phosphate-mannose-protein mannosyltransferase